MIAYSYYSIVWSNKKEWVDPNGLTRTKWDKLDATGVYFVPFIENVDTYFMYLSKHKGSRICRIVTSEKMNGRGRREVGPLHVGTSLYPKIFVVIIFSEKTTRENHLINTLHLSKETWTHPRLKLSSWQKVQWKKCTSPLSENKTRKSAQNMILKSIKW